MLHTEAPRSLRRIRCRSDQRLTRMPRSSLSLSLSYECFSFLSSYVCSFAIILFSRHALRSGLLTPILPYFPYLCSQTILLKRKCRLERKQMWWCKAHAEGGYKSNDYRPVHTRDDNYKIFFFQLINYKNIDSQAEIHRTLRPAHTKNNNCKVNCNVN